ncbi:MAG: YbaN family protein [Diaphorobacter sp.]
MPRPPEPMPPAPEQAPLPAPVRWLLLVLAALCLALGLVGILVPGLPSTVFILIAGWAAARSSPRLYRWLWFHPLFGSMLRNWANGGRVSRRAKWSATFLMALSALVLLVAHIPRWAAISALVCMACVLIWLWLRPEPLR